jgi:hypothetical protein
VEYREKSAFSLSWTHRDWVANVPSIVKLKAREVGSEQEESPRDLQRGSVRENYGRMGKTAKGQ